MQTTGVRTKFIRNEKFKTNMIGIFFNTKLDEENVTVNALIPAVLRRGCIRYKTMKSIATKLESLYGARFDCGVAKKGDKQILKFYGEAINNKYLEDSGEDIFYSLVSLIRQIIFDPLIINGRFKEEYIKQEKNKLKNIIESRKNDKVQYALERCYELMCDKEPFGLCEYGIIEDIDNIGSEELSKAYKKMLNDFEVDIIVSGDMTDEDFEKITKMFNFNSRNTEEPAGEDIEIREVKNFEEVFDVNQGKLSLGYRTNIRPSSKEYFEMLGFNGVLGGGVHSKLFQNVREKNSLAYYVFSRYDKFNGIVGISCGIEAQNYEKALKTILEQVDEMKKGNISAEEYNTTIKTIENSLNSMKDEQLQLLDFYHGQQLIGSDLTIEEVITEIKKVTVEDIVRVASRVTLDTIYFMKGRA
jgi:predicted Zn-dependent peptidase